MKTKLLLSVFLSFYFCLLYSQIPQGFNYQAVATNSYGAYIANSDLQVKLSILSDTITPVVVWEELHSSVRTNASGVFGLVIGTGTRQSGSALNFNEIDWTKEPLFLGIQIYYQSAWKNMGYAKLWSVPYSMVSGGLAGTVSKFAVTGTETSPDSALFEVKNTNGQTVFAVYNEGVRVYVDDGESKGTKGGFAIGGFDDGKGISQNLLTITSDSVRVYVDDGVDKATKGGFAIGGFDSGKGVSQNLLTVASDSVRIYVDKTAAKGSKGGFAIGDSIPVKAKQKTSCN